MSMPVLPAGMSSILGLDGNTPSKLPSLDGASNDGPDFASTLGNAIAGAGDAERQAADASEQFAAGDPNMGIHEVMIASEKANISLRYAVTLKNKAIEAYQELMNTPI